MINSGYVDGSVMGRIDILKSAVNGNFIISVVVLEVAAVSVGTVREEIGILVAAVMVVWWSG